MKSLTAAGTALFVLALPLVASAQSPVTLDAALQKRLGVHVAPLTPGSATSSVRGFARVLDPSPLVALLNDMDAARQAVRVSRAEAERTRALQALDDSVSRKVAEAAALQAAADTSRLTGLKQRLGLEWGPAFMGMGDAALAQLSAGLVMGQVALVRIDSPSGRNLTGLRTVSLDLPGGGSVAATVMGPARTADPLMKSGGLIARVSGAQAPFLSPGLTLGVSLPAAGGGQGVLIPAPALLRAEGKVWAYVTKDNVHFTRKPVVNGVYSPQGLVVASGFAVGERAVTAGASALYTAENAAQGAEE